MANHFKIIIHNLSGTAQTYNLFNKVPELTGDTKPKIFSNVLSLAAAPNTQTTQFTITDQFYAVVGNSQGKLGDKVVVQVTGNVPVKLGSKNKDGSVNKGTTLKLIVNQDVDAPEFDAEKQTDGGNVNSFEILTAAYQRLEAEKGNWIIGLGGGANGSGALPAAVIFPDPNSDFQIQPKNTWYIVPGRYEQGTVVDYTKIGKQCEVDFTKYPVGSVTIVHDEDGVLTIQK